MPFVKRVPPHPQPKYYVEYQAGGFLCYQRVEPATAHNNLLCIIDQMCSCTFALPEGRYHYRVRHDQPL